MRSNLALRLRPLAFAVVLACGAQARAEQADREAARLEEVVVTAPRSDEPLTVRTNPKAPRQPVPAHDGADYLKSIPGFSVIRKGGTDGDPVLRGMAGSRLNILLDGEQILGGCGQRMDPPTAYVYPAAYDRITVLKGPQTVLYGPGSSAGVVLFERDIKRAGQAGTKFSGALTLGSFGRNDVVADVRMGTENYFAQGAFTRSDANDYRDGNGAAVHSRYTRWSGNAAVGFTPDDNTRMELSAALSDGRAAYADRAMDGAKFARDNVGVKFDKRKLSSTVEQVEAQLYYNYVDHVMDNYSMRTFTASVAMPNPAASNPDRETAGARAVVGLALTDAARAKLGVDFQTNKHTNRSTMNQNTAPYESLARADDAAFRNYGLFGEADYALGEQARIIGGLRFDNWHAQDKRNTIAVGMGPVANPTAGQSRNETLTGGFARYERALADGGTVYAGLGRSERAPDYWELISKEGVASISAFNEIKPEKTTQADVGVIRQAGNWQLSLSGFYSKVDDFILIQSGVAKVMPARSATVARNVNATTWGGEAGLAYRFADSWKADASLAYVRGSNDSDGLSLAQLPPLEARLGATYDDRVWSFGALLRAVSAQERFALNQGNIAGQDIGRTGGFSVFSVNGGWRPNKGTQLTAGVDNLFDKSYAEHISRAGSMVAGFTQTTRVNEPGRNLWVKANIAF